MDIFTQFHNEVVGQLEAIQQSQKTVIEKLANLVAQRTVAGGVFFCFGSGHSHMIAEELYIRAGGLFTVKALLEPEFMLQGTRFKSTAYERISGLAKPVLELNSVQEGDILLVASNSGRNAVPVEMALEAQKLGAIVASVSNHTHSSKVSSRHESGKRLMEIADFVIDNCGVLGDAVLTSEGKSYKYGSMSTITGAYIAQLIVSQTIKEIEHLGEEPPVFISSNVDGSDAHNENLARTYFEKFPSLEARLK